MKQSKKQNKKSVVFGSVNTILQAKQGYAVDGTTEVVNRQCS
jgi:hypothetical protein